MVPNAITVFLTAESEEELVNRLRERKTEAPDKLKMRIATARKEMDIGMWLAGFPGLFWGTMMGFASFIPVVGTALIWIPAAAYLFLTGDTTWAIFLTVWSIAVVGSIDNLLRPLLMQGSAGMNTLMIFFSLLGGLHLFGLMGLIYGPLIFAITMVLFNLYEEEFQDFLDRQDQN